MNKASNGYTMYAVKNLKNNEWKLVSGDTFRHCYAENYRHNKGTKTGYKSLYLGKLMPNQIGWQVRKNNNGIFAVREGKKKILDSVELK